MGHVPRTLRPLSAPRAAAAALAMTGLLAAASAALPATAQAGTTYTVQVGNGPTGRPTFTPAELTIHLTDKVTWVFRDSDIWGLYHLERTKGPQTCAPFEGSSPFDRGYRASGTYTVFFSTLGDVFYTSKDQCEWEMYGVIHVVRRSSS